MEYKWIEKPIENNENVERLSKDLNISTNIAKLLVQRGISSYQEARDFFRPDLSKLHDPFLMKGMDKAVSRIEEALAKKEKILIYGDYDVDGTTAVALVFSFFFDLFTSKNIDYYIPDRYMEGYGISFKAVDYASENNFSLIIALDCGIKAIEKVAYATTKNIDFIICDHHLPGEVIPDAFSVLDPKQTDCTYPYKELSGCGVGFKLVQAFAKKKDIPFSVIAKYLDLVAISIAADIVPITGENRILAFSGLKKINKKPRPSIEAILGYSNVKKNKEQFVSQDATEDIDFFTKDITINDLVFLIAPRINAAGRVSTGKSAVELLIEKNREKVISLAENINVSNTERRALDINATEQALATFEFDDFLKTSKSTVILNENWHKGIIGIVASRLTENFYRPTIVCTKSNGIITGSARSVKDFDIYAAIDYCSELLQDFGGHKFAAGLSMKPENFEAFRTKFEEYVSNNLTEQMMQPEIEIDLKIKLKEITPKFFRILKQFAPFGPGNMSPIFLTESVYDEGYARTVGENHMKLSVSEASSPLVHFNAIAFRQAHHIYNISKGKLFDICYHIEENSWRGNKDLQLNIKDIKLSDELL